MWRLNKTERSQGTLDNKKELRRQDEMMQKKAHKWLGIVDKPVEEEPPAAVRGKKREPEKKHQKGSSQRFQLLQTQQQRKRGRRNWISQTNPTPKKQGYGEGKLKTALVLPKKNLKKRLIKTRKKKRRKRQRITIRTSTKNKKLSEEVQGYTVLKLNTILPICVCR